MNGDVDGAAFTLYSHPRSQVDSCTAVDLTGGNVVFYSIAHQKAERKSVVLAANGPDRRVCGIGPKSALERKFTNSVGKRMHLPQVEKGFETLFSADRPIGNKDMRSFWHRSGRCENYRCSAQRAGPDGANPHFGGSLPGTSYDNFQ